MADFITGGAKSQNAEIFIGKKFGKYEVKEKIGQGAMGIILKVWDTLEDVYKAIKMVPPELSFDRLSFIQLKKEVNASSKISHPNVIKVMGLEEFQGLYFIIMEYVNGVTLADKLADSSDGKIEEEIVLEYMKQICLGLKEAHENGVIHLDLKPQNIMITVNGKIKILDFSISHQITKSMTMLTGQNLSTGTLPYMAPEQLLRKFGRVNEQTDIWGLGATMYHLLSGEVPYDDREQILNMDDEPYELEEVSNKTKEIISGCMAKDRKVRFININDVLNKFGFSINNNDNTSIENISNPLKQSINKKSEMKGDLSISTNIDCVIFVNGNKHNTKEKYLYINDLIYGEIEIKAETPKSILEQKIHLEKKLTKISLKLEPKVAGLFAKSKVGEFELVLNNKTYKCPEIIENIPPEKYEVEIIYKGKHYLDSIHLINNKTIIYELNNEKLEIFKKDIEKKDWENTCQEDTLASYEEYLSKYPVGEYKKNALKKKKIFKKKELEIRVELMKQNIIRESQKQQQIKITDKEIKTLLLKKFNISENNLKKNKKGFYEEEFENKTKMIYIPEGEFIMGDNELNEEKKNCIEHKVYLDGYWIGKYPVTFEQYNRCCDETGMIRPDDEGWGRKNRPVINVSLQQILYYCNWISQKSGLKFQLLTEAEWENAAKGIVNNKYPWGSSDLNDTLANSNYINERTTPVDQYEKGASIFGCLDMAGNVWETCSDWYSKEYYNNSPYKNPEGPKLGSKYVCRGGSWNRDEEYLRCSFRFTNDPQTSNCFLGFRLALQIKD